MRACVPMNFFSDGCLDHKPISCSVLFPPLAALCSWGLAPKPAKDSAQHPAKDSAPHSAKDLLHTPLRALLLKPRREGFKNSEKEQIVLIAHKSPNCKAKNLKNVNNVHSSSSLVLYLGELERKVKGKLKC